MLLRGIPPRFAPAATVEAAALRRSHRRAQRRGMRGPCMPWTTVFTFYVTAFQLQHRKEQRHGSPGTPWPSCPLAVLLQGEEGMAGLL